VLFAALDHATLTEARLTIDYSSAGATIVTTDLNASGSGALAAASAARIPTALSASGSGTMTAVGAATSASVLSASGSGTLAAVGATGAERSTELSATGSGALSAVATSIAATAFNASGAGSATFATTPASVAVGALSAAGTGAASFEAADSGFVEAPAATPILPVGGGGGFGPLGYRQDKQRFRTKKDKSHPKVITVRIGNWPEDPQIILERREQAERDEFYQSFPDAPFEEIVESGDDEEAILLAILAIAA
jgi:hypothetical protein